MTWGPFLRCEIAAELASGGVDSYAHGFGPWRPKMEMHEARRAMTFSPDLLRAHRRRIERESKARTRGARRAAKRMEASS
jgi:hypothetical protein